MLNNHGKMIVYYKNRLDRKSPFPIYIYYVLMKLKHQLII